MSYAAIKTFFSTLATENDLEFAHNLEHLSEKIGVSLKGGGNLILVMDEPKGRLKYNGQKFDLTAYGFWLLQKVDKGKWEEEDVVYDLAKAALKTIESAMDEQMEAEDGPLKHYEPGSIAYEKVGPELKSRLFGVYVSFTMVEKW